MNAPTNLHDYLRGVIDHLVWFGPTLLRISMPFWKSALDYAFHAAAHKTLHVGSHRFHFIGKLFKKYPFALDVIMIVLLMAFSLLLEAHEAHEEHGSPEIEAHEKIGE